MCGIVGFVGQGNTKDILLSGLSRLEYRGYDSAGIALYSHPLKYKKIDIIAYLYYLIYMLICIALVFVFRK